MLFIGACMPIKLKKKVIFIFLDVLRDMLLLALYQCLISVKNDRIPLSSNSFHLVLNSRKHLITAVYMFSAQRGDCVEPGRKSEWPTSHLELCSIFHGFLSQW